MTYAEAGGSKLTVNFTDNELSRLQEIREAHAQDPNWKPPDRTREVGRNDAAIKVTLPSTLDDRIRTYAKETGRSISAVMRDAMIVLTTEYGAEVEQR